MASDTVLGVFRVCPLLRKQRNTIAVATAPIATRPPMTPPTIGPTGVECFVTTGEFVGPLTEGGEMAMAELAEVTGAAAKGVEEPVSYKGIYE
jgi:hypothetical protein